MYTHIEKNEMELKRQKKMYVAGDINRTRNFFTIKQKKRHAE